MNDALQRPKTHVRRAYLADGVYCPTGRDDQGRLLSRLMKLTLALWKGMYRGIEGTWLRWTTPDGIPLSTDAEAALASAAQERQKDEHERQRADEKRACAESAEQELARLKVLLDGRG